MNAFWMLGSRKPFDVMKFRSLFFRIVEKSFPMHEVSAIGKLTGLVGSSWAFPFGIRVIEGPLPC